MQHFNVTKQQSVALQKRKKRGKTMKKLLALMMTAVAMTVHTILVSVI